MTDETQAETSMRRGRPAGSRNKPKRANAQREPVHQPMHDNADDLESFDPELYTPSDPMRFPPDVIRTLENDFGHVLQWVTTEVGGKAYPDFVNHRRRQGFQEVRRGSFQGLLRPYVSSGDANGVVTVEGAMLMTIPIQFWRKIKAKMKAAADEAKARHEQAHRTEGVNVPGGDHESALAHNKHRHGYSPYEKVPD